VLFPVESIAEICRSRGVLYHCDAVQTAGKVKIDVRKIPAEYLSLTGHKFHVPKGIGAPYVRRKPPTRTWKARQQVCSVEDSIGEGRRQLWRTPSNEQPYSLMRASSSRHRYFIECEAVRLINSRGVMILVFFQNFGKCF